MKESFLRPEIEENRKADFPIHPLILNRWSPRSMTGESISEEELMSLFEAARWAPSCYNNQPWRFLYAKRDTPLFSTFLSLLVEFNQKWAEKAAVLGAILSCKLFEKTKKPCVTHALDTGAAWENLSLEGTSQNLVIHGMQGFDYEKARDVFQLPVETDVLAMFAVGKRGLRQDLSAELEQREFPSSRKKVSEFAHEGTYRSDWKLDVSEKGP